jgi:hypothetical protein
MPAITFTLVSKAVACEPDRKDPLKVSTEYAYTEKRARALLDASLTENVKKGWEKT